MDELFLREFIDLAHTCNFQQSADNMSISASSLSKHIQKMENELQVQLFDRSTRSVTLSKYGTILLSYAEQIISLAEQCHRDLNNAKTIDNAQLNIGFLPMLGHYGILELLSDFNDLYPAITLNIIESNKPELLLLEKKFDFVFVDSFGPKDSQINKLLLKTDYLAAVIPSASPLAQQTSVAIEELRGKPLLLQTNSSGKPTMTTQAFLSACQKCGFEATVSLRSRYATVLLQQVEIGKGIAILNTSEIRSPQQDEYKILRIEPVIPFDICVSYLPHRAHGTANILFLQYLKQCRESSI